MVIRLSNLSVAKIRERFVKQRALVSPQLLSEMHTDPRKGVRFACQTLKHRQEKENQEHRRVQFMLGYERALWRSGAERVAGVDEAGVGPLAGPVVAAAVIFRPGTLIPKVDDSKRVRPKERERLAKTIRRQALAVAIGVAEIDEIDTLNIYQAGILAMQRAVEELTQKPDHLLIDARKIAALSIPQTSLVGGDRLSFSIAAASIVAKTFRDQMMADLGQKYPLYGFEKHKGYGTTAHREAIRRFGPCPQHRRSFAFTKKRHRRHSNLFCLLKGKLLGVGSRSQARAFEGKFSSLKQRLSPKEAEKVTLMMARRWPTILPKPRQ